MRRQGLRVRVLVTGGSGFVGSAFVPFAGASGGEVIAATREELKSPEQLLRRVDAVLHLAAIAHTRGVDAAAYQAVNCDLPVSVATKARDLGVRRFVFVSSSHAATHAHTPYGASKAAAERELLSLKGIEMVVARPALVYGAGAKGNFGALLRLARLPIPLPLSEGRRSMVHIDNVVAALAFLLTAPKVEGQTFFVTDPGPPLSVAEIIALLRRTMGRRPMLLSVPWLPELLAILGQKGPAEKVFRDQVVDGGPLFAAGWQPPLTAEEGLARAAGMRPEGRPSSCA